MTAVSATGDRVRLGVVQMCHEHFDLAARLARTWADGGAELMIHVDSRVDESEFAALQSELQDHPHISFSQRYACHWGRFDLVQATQVAAEELLARSPDITHVLLVSGSCLPLRPVSELEEYLSDHPKSDFIESVSAREASWVKGGLNEERFLRYFFFDWRTQRGLFDRFIKLQRKLGIKRKLPEGVVPHLGSQWWCLTRETLSAILNDPRRAEFDRYFQLSWIPDESYFQTLARRHSQHIEGRSLTLASFNPQGKPYMLYDDHAQLLQESGGFIARKVWNGAHKLIDHFPHPSAPEVARRVPDHQGRIEQMFSEASDLRTQGRPGLRMQSRFPQKRVQTGRSAGRYAVLQGFAEVISGFESWLAGQVDAEVHGHLLGTDRVEFAGRPEIGPGGWPSNPGLRDRDPESFLTSLIRISDRKQIFQYGPADLQDLNWFMATDYNCRLMVVTGAWVVPLFRSDMPFERLRKAAARMLQAEAEQLKILKSSWPRARLDIWTLADLVAEPKRIVAEALTELPGFSGKVDDLPPLHDLGGLGTFLQEMRRAGLPAGPTGHFPLVDPVCQKSRKT